MKIQWRVTGLYIIINSLSLLLFWLGMRALTGPILRYDPVTIILAVLLPGAIVYFFAQRLAKRIVGIHFAMESIAKGEFKSTNLPDHPDELGQLATEVMRLSQQTKASILSSAQEAQKIQAILTGMQEGVIALDQVGRIVLLNTAAEQIFGRLQAQIRNKDISELGNFPKLEKLLNDALEKKIVGSTELALKERFVRAQVSPIFGAQNISGGAVIVCYDVTELRRLEQIRTEFVGNVSHELRTPLTSIKGFAETLQDGAVEDPVLRERFLGIIQTETLRLQRLIDDLLTLSHIENRDNRRLEALEHKGLVQEAFAKIKPVIEPYAQAKGISLDVELSADLPQVAMGTDLLSQVLLNLLENAVKYTAAGKVWLRGSEEGNLIRLEFGDTGAGIPEKDLPRIFERFYRVDKARAREQGGSGLGLSIVKHIVEGSGGKIEVCSKLGQGTVFYCDLPRARRGGEDEENKVTQNASG